MTSQAADDAAHASAVVERRVSLAHALAVARTALEAALLAVAVAAFVLGVERLERSAGTATRAAALAACCAALAWWIERRPTRGATLRRIERRHALDGALLAFDELAHARAHRSRFERLLAARLAALLTPSAILRAAAPSHPGLLVLPLMTCAFYLWARDASTAVAPRPGVELRERASDAPDAPNAIERLEARADAAARGPTAGDARAAAASQASLELARELRRTLELAATSHTGLEHAAGVLERGRELARARDLPAELRDALALALDEGAARVDALRDAERARSTADAGSTAAMGGNGEAGAGASAGAGGAAPGTSPSASDSTGAASDARGTSPAADAATTTAVASAGPWWSPRYDAVVERWVEARRVPH